MCERGICESYFEISEKMMQFLWNLRERVWIIKVIEKDYWDMKDVLQSYGKFQNVFCGLNITKNMIEK